MNAESHDQPLVVVETAHKQSAVMMEIAGAVINFQVLIIPFLGMLVGTSTRASAAEAILGGGGGH